MDYTIRQLFEKVLNGQIRIPSFQRGFVWEPEKVAHLMDSIYKGYPFGNLLFWRTKEILKSERQIGNFPIIVKEEGLPIDYVLDGQQRITSIFGVFQTEIDTDEDFQQFNIYYDFSLENDAQEAQFFSLEDEDVDLSKHFPLNCLFDSVKYREATNHLDIETVARIDALQTKFKEARIPIQFLETEDKAKVSIVFERINRKGVELDTFQLLNAWTWSDDFDLQNKFKDLQNELEPYGFDRVGEDVDLILKCGAAILAHNASSKSLIDLKSNEFRERFQEITNGLKGSIDFLKNNLKIGSLKNLPYTTMLIPLSAFFASKDRKRVLYNDEQRRVILKWFWRTAFTKRYSSSVIRNLNVDIAEIVKLKKGEPHELGNFNIKISPDYYLDNSFRSNPVVTKTFILQLAQNQPLSFITGSPVSLRNVLQNYNSNEFHHIFPKAYLKSLGKRHKEINCLANISIISKADNLKISDNKPSVYLQYLPDKFAKIFNSSFIPENIFKNKFKATINQRSNLLWKNACHLMGKNAIKKRRTTTRKRKTTV